MKGILFYSILFIFFTSKSQFKDYAFYGIH